MNLCKCVLKGKVHTDKILLPCSNPQIYNREIYNISNINQQLTNKSYKLGATISLFFAMLWKIWCIYSVFFILQYSWLKLTSIIYLCAKLVFSLNKKTRLVKPTSKSSVRDLCLISWIFFRVIYFIVAFFVITILFLQLLYWWASATTTLSYFIGPICISLFMWISVPN